MRFLFILLLAATLSQARAQTNTVKSAPPAPTEISSDSATYDNTARQLIYYGNVLVSDPKIKLRCAQLTVDLPPEGQSRPTNIVAITNVVIDFVDEKGLTNHLTSDKAVYVFTVVNAVTNWNVTFTGSPGHPPRVETPQYIATSEPLIRDLATDKYKLTHEIITIKPGVMGGTNSSPFKF